MTVTIEIPDDTADRFRIAAENAGLDPTAFATAVVENAVAEVPSTADTRSSHMTASDKAYVAALRLQAELATHPMPWADFFATMLEGVDPNRPPLSDYAVSREGIYEDHP